MQIQECTHILQWLLWNFTQYLIRLLLIAFFQWWMSRTDTHRYRECHPPHQSKEAAVRTSKRQSHVSDKLFSITFSTANFYLYCSSFKHWHFDQLKIFLAQLHENCSWPQPENHSYNHQSPWIKTPLLEDHYSLWIWRSAVEIKT